MCSMVVWAFLGGTKSIPPLLKGLHLSNRLPIKNRAFNSPNLSKDIIAYVEQVGVNLHLSCDGKGVF